MEAPIRGTVRVTDTSWYEFLRTRAELDEVNFWLPGATPTRDLPGTPWFFKAKAPVNAIVGGGFFLRYDSMPMSVAWDAFGEKNGASDYRSFERAVFRIRQRIADQDGPRPNAVIGCVVLGSPFFFTPDEYVASPADWHPNIVAGKGYDLNSPIGSALWTSVQGRLAARHARAGLPPPPPFSPMVGKPRLIIPRLGQGGFRLAVMDAYQRRCAITGERTLPVVEAAHIRPFAEVQEHQITNGIALRSDIHRLFDQGYVTVDPAKRFRVSRAIRDDFENGRDYYALHGKEIRLPQAEADQPNSESLDWHASTLYRGD
jgi:putative restriction endonuclease